MNGEEHLLSLLEGHLQEGLQFFTGHNMVNIVTSLHHILSMKFILCGSSLFGDQIFLFNQSLINSRLEEVKVLVVKEDLLVGESALDSLLEGVDDVQLLAGSHEHEWDSAVLEHVEDLVED